MGAVPCEELWESAHRVLAEVHVAEGNVSEALRVYVLYHGLLRSELGLEPTPRFAADVASLTA